MYGYYQSQLGEPISYIGLTTGIEMPQRQIYNQNMDSSTQNCRQSTYNILQQVVEYCLQVTHLVYIQAAWLIASFSRYLV